MVEAIVDQRPVIGLKQPMKPSAIDEVLKASRRAVSSRLRFSCIDSALSVAPSALKCDPSRKGQSLSARACAHRTGFAGGWPRSQVNSCTNLGAPGRGPQGRSLGWRFDSETWESRDPASSARWEGSGTGSAFSPGSVSNRRCQDMSPQNPTHLPHCIAQNSSGILQINSGHCLYSSQQQKARTTLNRLRDNATSKPSVAERAFTALWENLPRELCKRPKFTH